MKKRLLVAILVLGAAAWLRPVAFAQDQDTNSNDQKQQTSSINEEIVVSATKNPEDSTEVPQSTAVITGQELKRTGAKTIAEAIQNIVGVEANNGADEGPFLSNIGMWGLKEFDALLVTVDGVPVGGPFNPSLSQINVDDVDRIEIIKGPQGTLYGVSAFAGMVQVFTRKSDEDHGSVSGGGGSFSTGFGSGSYSASLAPDTKLRFYGKVAHGDGWQDRTGVDDDRFTLNLDHNTDKSKFQVTFNGYRFDQDWGSPIPIDQGQIVPGFVIDRNYAIGGAEIEHHVFGVNTFYSRPLNSNLQFQNIFGFAHDDQRYLRSFIMEIEFPNELGGVDAGSEGILLNPEELSMFEEGRLLTTLNAGGTHQIVAGAAVTWGRTEADGHGFDFEHMVTPDVEVVPFSDITSFGDNRGFEDHRTFFGVYAHDEWAPHPRVKVSGGIRVDHTSETLDAEFEELGGGEGEGVEGTTHDERADTKLSGDGSVLFRLIAGSTPATDRVSVYFTAKSNFKPAAPNLTEAEDATILKPERTHSIEGGAKARLVGQQLWANLSIFDMDFQNLVVSQANENGEPELINAGEERFTGFEADLEWRPEMLSNTSLSFGYAHHNPKFEDFTFATPDGEFVDVGGNFLELAPRNLFNGRAMYSPERGIGGFVAFRFTGERFLNRRNTFTTPSFTEWDAGVSYQFSQFRVQVAGRNLSDEREPITESEIGDAQFYISAARRFNVEASWSF